MPAKATELAIGIELATGKVVGPVAFEDVSQTLCTSPVGMDGRWFFHVGAGYSGMVMMQMDRKDFRQVGLRLPTVKSWMPLPGGSKTQEKLDYCLTSTPAMAGGSMYFYDNFNELPLAKSHCTRNSTSKKPGAWETL